MRFLLWYFGLWAMEALMFGVACFVAWQFIELPAGVYRLVLVINVPLALFYACVYDGTRMRPTYGRF